MLLNPVDNTQENQKIAERFLDKIEFEPMSGCWLWSAAVKDKRSGYGAFRMRGRVIRSHRVAWNLFVDAIPDGLCVLHKCDTPSCVNPDHLFIGTPKDNSDDCIRKGRDSNLRGVNHGMAKLTEAEVIKIRQEYQPIRGSLANLGRKYGVTRQQIFLIINNKKWKHV